jgi:hypothetical protein
MAAHLSDGARSGAAPALLSSCASTEPASFFASLTVGFFSPERTLEAKVDIAGDDSFLGIFEFLQSRQTPMKSDT